MLRLTLTVPLRAQTLQCRIVTQRISFHGLMGEHKAVIMMFHSQKKAKHHRVVSSYYERAQLRIYMQTIQRNYQPPSLSDHFSNHTDSKKQKSPINYDASRSDTVNISPKKLTDGDWMPHIFMTSQQREAMKTVKDHKSSCCVELDLHSLTKNHYLK